MKIPLTLGYDSDERKRIPFLATVIGYFTAALRGVAIHCVESNEKHNPGEPVHWARGKSMDHDECIVRHSIDIKEMRAWLKRNPGHPVRAAVVDTLEIEMRARSWRALADHQEFCEEFRGAPLSAASRLPESPEVPERCQFSVDKGAYMCELPKGHSGLCGSTSAPVPVLDFSHEIPMPPALVEVDGMLVNPEIWPPFGSESDYPAIWKGHPRDAFFVNPETQEFEKSPAWVNAGGNSSFPTEAAARAAYWAIRK